MRSKFIGKSLTVQGALVLFIMYLLQRFGLDVEESVITNFVETGLAFAGFAMIIFGRWKAKHELHIKK